MVEGRRKSRTLRRVDVKTPGGRTVQHYRLRKPRKAKCGGCGKVLPGVPHGRAVDVKRKPKNQRRPERPYGGNLCSTCARRKIKQSVRAGND